MLFNLQIPKIEAPKEWNIGSIGTEIIVDDIQVGMKMQVKKEKQVLILMMMTMMAMITELE